MTIGDMIRARARELAQTDEAVARQFDVSSSTVTRWRTGATTPQANKIPALARWLGVSEAEVIAALHTDEGPTLDDVMQAMQALAERVGRVEALLAQDALTAPKQAAGSRRSSSSSAP